MTGDQPVGTVYLVGAGPGDPDLLTVRAARLLERADAVVYDALVSPRILERIPRDAERRFVGKRKGRHYSEQQDTNELLVELAARHAVVVRLKGGDCFVFGRGAEEQEHLVSRGIPVEVVPGITSAIAAPAYAGIPLTHRDHAPLVVIATGHRRKGAEDSPVDWKRVGALGGTVSVLMGIKRLGEITGGLIAGGRSPDTPAALVEWGTTGRQRRLVSTLLRIADDALDAGLEPPSVLTVGEVVSLHHRLDWFHSRPLRGRRVLVARSRPRATPVADALAALGAEVLALPPIRAVSMARAEPLVEAARSLSRYDWIVAIGGDSADSLLDALEEAGLDARALSGVRVVAVGPATARALRARGLRADQAPWRHGAREVADGLEPVEDRSFLVLRSQVAGSALSAELRQRGAAEVVDLAAYHVEVVDSQLDEVSRIEAGIDAACFPARAAIDAVDRAVGLEVVRQALGDGPCLCLAQGAAKRLCAAGFDPTVCAPATVGNMVKAVTDRLGPASEDGKAPTSDSL